MWIFNSLIIAIAMYSKIPMPQAEWNEKNMRYAMCFFPVVGVVIGAAEFAAGYALLHWLHCKPLLFSVAMTLIPVLITGGIHLDGFADTVDAMSSYAERERRLEILKDPHTGAFAIIGLCCYFLANVGIWSEIGEKKLLVACCIFAFSRAMSGLAVVSFKAAKNSGLLRTFQDGAAKRSQSGYDAVGSTDGFYSAENFTSSRDCSVGDGNRNLCLLLFIQQKIFWWNDRRSCRIFSAAL